MTVKELIKQLNTCDSEKEIVFITEDDGFCVAEEIKVVFEEKDRVAIC